MGAGASAVPGRERGTTRRPRRPGRQARQPLPLGRPLPRLRPRVGRIRATSPSRHHPGAPGGCPARPPARRPTGRHCHLQGAGVKKTEAPSFEEGLKQLEEIVQKLEKGELALEESLRLYEEGIHLSRLSHPKLHAPEGKIAVLINDS